MKDEAPVRILTYKRVWKIERTLYKLDKIKLPRPITVWQILYFIFAFLAVVIIDKHTFFLKWIPGTLRYVFLPGGIAFYLSKAKHDGRAPHRFIAVQVKYFLAPKYYNRYQESNRSGKQKYEGSCTFRELYTKN